MNGGVQGMSRPDRELLDAAALCGHLLGEGSVPAFPAEHRHSPVTGTNYFGLQQQRWSPENIADTDEEALARLFMLPGAHYSDPEFAGGSKPPRPRSGSSRAESSVPNSRATCSWAAPERSSTRDTSSTSTSPVTEGNRRRRSRLEVRMADNNHKFDTLPKATACSSAETSASSPTFRLAPTATSSWSPSPRARSTRSSVDKAGHREAAVGVADRAPQPGARPQGGTAGPGTGRSNSVEEGRCDDQSLPCWLSGLSS